MCSKGVFYFSTSSSPVVTVFTWSHELFVPRELRSNLSDFTVPPCWRKVATLSSRGGGRQDGDGGCRQGKVYMYVGGTEKDKQGSDAT